jgi:hypothetical protein
MKNIITLLIASFLLFSCVEVENPIDNTQKVVETQKINEAVNISNQTIPAATLVNNNCGGEIILGVQVRIAGESTLFDYSPGTWIHCTIATKDNCGTIRHHKVMYPQFGSNSFIEQKLPKNYLPGSEWIGYSKYGKNYKSKLREINSYKTLTGTVYDTLQSYKKDNGSDDVVVHENAKGEVEHILIVNHISQSEFIKGLGVTIDGSKDRGFDRGDIFNYGVYVTTKSPSQNRTDTFYLGDFYGPNKLANTKTYLNNPVVRTLGEMPK